MSGKIPRRIQIPSGNPAAAAANRPKEDTHLIVNLGGSCFSQVVTQKVD